MEEQSRFKRIERINELIVAVMVFFGLIIVWLPLTPVPNRLITYLAAFFALIFTFTWHKLKVPISPTNKNFIESLVDLTAIAVIIHVTGGVRSYFSFLYLLPNIDTATNSPRKYTIACWLFTSALIFGEGFIFTPNSQYISYAILNSWAVALVSIYGGILAKEVANAEQATTSATIEKEKSINTLKDEFLFIISHELRSPITAIRGYLELLTTENSGKIIAEVRNLAAAAFRQSNRLNDLIEQLLDVSRLETGKFRLVMETFDLNDFLKGVLGEIIPDAQERKIKVSYSPSSSAVTVTTDKERLRGVVRQLFDNSFRYTGEFGEIWVKVVAKGDAAYISVVDNGVGISSEELPHIFERFHKGSQRDSEQIESTGIELFLAKNLVEKMGGEIFVESQVGKGSNFTFSIPLTKPSQ